MTRDAAKKIILEHITRAMNILVKQGFSKDETVEVLREVLYGQQEEV